MKLETKRLLRGPNRWSDGTAVEGIVALVPGEDMRARWTQLEADYPELMARVGRGAPAEISSPLFWAHVVGRLLLELHVGSRSLLGLVRLGLARGRRSLLHGREARGACELDGVPRSVRCGSVREREAREEHAGCGEEPPP